MPEMSLGSAMAGAKPKGKSQERRENDFYATPPDVTQALIGANILEGPHVWEPACGDGAMARVLAANGFLVVASDLHDYNYGQSGVDFTKARSTFAPVIVTNPPFNLALSFILTALRLEGVVQFAFLLKSTYWNAAERAELLQEHPPSHWLPVTWRADFTGAGNPTMDLCWGVWSVGGVQRAPTLMAPLVRPTVQAQQTLELRGRFESFGAKAS